MIFPLAGIFIGAILGVFQARSRGGKRKDMLQWGAVYAILLGLVGLFILIYLQRAFS